jgi:tetratricopeptide (TPR) repeat protein
VHRPLVASLVVFVAPLLAGFLQPSPAAAPAAPPEDAYRANNRGVGLLEQYKFPEAVAELQTAVALAPGYAQARINLAIAQFYVPDLAAAKKTALEAIALAPASPQPPYLLGLIARAENDAAVALRELARVRALDPGDVGVNVNLGQVLLETRRYDEAIPVLEAAARAEPFNVTAAYSLGTALVRAGRRDEGAAVLSSFERLRESPYRTQFGRNYLEQGRYAEALASTGAEAELVDVRAPEPSFTVDDLALPASARLFEGRSLRLAGFDWDRDADVDLVVATGDRVVLLRNEGGRFVDATAATGLSGRRASAAVAGDLDNDGQPDLLLLGPLALLRGDGARFTDATSASRLPADSPATVAALADLDHDGDLDVVLGGSTATASSRLLRNNGDGTFSDVTADAKLATPGTVAALVPSDFDNRRDLDLLVARRDGPPLLLLNRRDGTFEDAAAAMRLPPRPGPAVAAGDVNKDGFTDLLIGGLLLSDGRGGFEQASLPVDLTAARSLQLVDVDADGLLDVVAAGQQGLTVLRNLGSGWSDKSPRAVPKGLPALAEVLAFDADGDGDEDLATAGSDGSLRLLRNGAGGNRSLRVALTGRASNRGGVGAKLELRAGSLRQKIESYATTPPIAPADVVFGLGRRPAADALRILWPSGILQTETELGTRAAVAFTELDRKPSSCPFLYAWNGKRFDFVSDFLGGGEMGYWLAPGVRNEPDPVEYVRIAPEQIAPRNERYELAVTNELEEVLYLDRLELLAVAHPADVEVHPAEGMTHAPRPFELFGVRDLRTPRATGDDGRDWTDAVSRIDRRFAEGVERLPIRGYAKDHSLTLDLAALPEGHSLLLLTAWTDYAFSSDNVAAHQRGLSLEPPVLEALGADGVWRTALADVGIPVGRPQTVVWDLARLPKGGSRTLRLRTNMRIYWDRIALAAPAALALEPRTLPRVRADLSERGFSAEVSADGREPFTYDYERVSRPAPWKLMPGRYTRTGDVSELVAESDDLYVVARPGDAVSLSFDARGLPPLRAGWTRTFLLKGDGFSKEMDLNSASPDVAEPLPFHGMPSYPYPPGAASETLRRNAATQARYNTRVVARPFWPLELLP